MIKPVDYKQYDSRWANHDYSAPGESRTIKSSGCGPTSAADILARFIDSKITPITTADWSKAHGYKYPNQGTAYSYFAPQFKVYGITCKQLNSTDARNMSQAAKAKLVSQVTNLLTEPGNTVIACMGPGNWTSGGHYIVAWKMDSMNVYICDPASSAPNRACNTKKLFFEQAKYFWQVKWGTKTKVQSRSKLYSRTDEKSKAIQDVFTGDVVWIIEDCKDGWSKVATTENIGYFKNSDLKAAVLSSFPKARITQDCWLRDNNNRLATKTCRVPAGEIVSVSTKRKYWSKVSFRNGKGWVKTKFLEFRG